MARMESDREDLFEELRSAVSRWEFQHPKGDGLSVAGIRRDGRLSVYFTPDECYHFHAAGGLIRAYRDGFLYRTQGDTLARLHRVRSAAATELVRLDLSTSERDSFLLHAERKLFRLYEGICGGDLQLFRHLTDEQNPWQPLLSRIESLIAFPLFLAPAYSTRRD